MEVHEQEDENVGELSLMSFNNVSGSSREQPQTMRLRGEIVGVLVWWIVAPLIISSTIN